MAEDLVGPPERMVSESYARHERNRKKEQRAQMDPVRVHPVAHPVFPSDILTLTDVEFAHTDVRRALGGG